MFKRRVNGVFQKRKMVSLTASLSISDISDEESESVPTTADGNTIPSITVVSHPNVPDNVDPDSTEKWTEDKQGGMNNPAFIPDSPPTGVSDQNTAASLVVHPESRERETWAVNTSTLLPGVTMEMSSLPPHPSMIFPITRSMSATLSDTGSWLETNRGSNIGRHIQSLVRAFANRAQRIKERIIQPPTPSPSPPPVDQDDSKGQARLSSLIPSEEEPTADTMWLDEQVKVWCCRVKRRYIPKFPKVLDPQSKLYISWLLIVTIFYLYNVWVIFLRAIFPYQTSDNLPYFLIFDYLADSVYLIDILLFKVRLQYLEDGFWVDESAKTRKNYLRKIMFKMDVLSLAPLDLLYLKYGPNTLFRLPRVLKVQTFWEFFNRVDAVAKSPYIIRIIRTLIYMMFLIHLNACAYYAMSMWEGIRSNSWVFQGEGNAYIRCFYFATKTATSIGKNPKPQNEYEYVFMTFSWLMGVFIFAFLIGQIRDIVATATQSKTQYRHLMDQTVRYMRNLNLPDDLQRKVRLWLNHTWEQQKTLNESNILDSLPKKMKTDVAINVHYNTLVKVQLFKDCDKALLRDLVLKLKPVLFLPGDYICKKGEVGKEMYIVNKGFVQVMGGEKGDVVLATLSEGSVFGEISLLGIPGFNRRTADVRSQGFSNLFVLSKDELWDALKHYPEAQNVLRKKAKDIIKQNEARNKTKDKKGKRIQPEMIIKQITRRPSTPRLIKTVFQMLKPVESQSVIAKSSSMNFQPNPSPCEPSKVEFGSNKLRDIHRETDAKDSNEDGAIEYTQNFPSRDLTETEEKPKFSNVAQDDSSDRNEKPLDSLQDDLLTTHTAEEHHTHSFQPQSEKDDIDEHAAVANEFLQNIIEHIPDAGDVSQVNIPAKLSESISIQLEDKTKSGSYSEDSGISIDLKSRNFIRSAQRNLETEKHDESFSSSDSVAENDVTKGSAPIADCPAQNNQPSQPRNDWTSLTSSVLSLHSLFKGSPISTSSLSEEIIDLQRAVDQDEPYLYRTPSNLSASSLAGYDNLAFVPQDLISSRRSSLLSDDTPC